MSSELITTFSLKDGTVSRYAKPSFISSYTISPVLFDLRDRTPPEKFVSFYKVEEESEEERFISALKYLNIIPKQSGAMVLLDIKKSLDEVNDEENDIVSFTEQNLPHCGLIYLTTNLTKIQEAKTTLSYLASERFRLIKHIEYSETKLVPSEKFKV